MTTEPQAPSTTASPATTDNSHHWRHLTDYQQRLTIIARWTLYHYRQQSQQQ